MKRGEEEERGETSVLAVFPVDRVRACRETLDVVEGLEGREAPYDAFAGDRLFVHRLMRLAYEDEASWMVEALEPHREKVAAQVAYALALEREAGLR